MWKKRYGFFARISTIFEETFLHCHFDRSLLAILYRFYCFKVDTWIIKIRQQFNRKKPQLNKFYFDIEAFKVAGTIKNSDPLVDSFDEN